MNKQCSTSRGGVCGNCGSKHPPHKCKAFGKKCHSCGKLNHYQSMCRSQNRSQSQHKGNSTTKQSNAKLQNQQRQSQRDFYEVNNVLQDEFDFQHEQDSITILFNTQMREKNVMFDEITSHPNLQCALTDLHVSEPGSNSNGRSICFKVDTGACGNLLPVNLYKQIEENKAKANFL